MIDPTTSIPEAIGQAVRASPEKRISILDRRGRAQEDLSYVEFERRILQAASRVKALGIQPNDVVLVCLHTSWDWIDAWFGALYVGALPLAVAPAGAMGDSARQATKLERIVTSFEVKKLIADAHAIKDLALQNASAALACALDICDFQKVTPSTNDVFVTKQSDDIAFLQLTSGSTGFQRAVQITHRGALHNPLAISEAVAYPYGCSIQHLAGHVVSWLPLYHDMGLVGCFLYALVNGLNLTFMRPDAFLARPHLWLQQISKHGKVLSPAPNFAYQTCADRVGADVDLDLSGWKAAMTGAEMIRPETVAQFNACFAERGFDARSLKPCFGLASGGCQIIARC